MDDSPIFPLHGSLGNLEHFTKKKFFFQYPQTVSVLLLRTSLDITASVTSVTKILKDVLL